MTGREKVEAALSPPGSGSIPVVIPYESVLIRDRWEELVADPWWHLYSPDLQVQLEWRRNVLRGIENDFLELPLFHTREQRQALSMEQRPDGILLLDRRSGEEKRLEREPIGGSLIEDLVKTTGVLATSAEAVDRLVPELEGEEADTFLRSGRADVALSLVQEFGSERYPIFPAKSPLWACHNLWGFEPLMRNIAAAPDLVHYACRRCLAYSLQKVRRAVAMGAAGIWIEECLTDLVSPQAYAALNLPYLRQLVQAIHAAGLSAVLYFCGDPAGKIELLIQSDCDALGFEESKKNFRIDIAELADQIDGRCSLLGNIDAVEVLEKGSERQLRAEISRQIQVGRRNGGRFITSVGSPITPATSLARVRSYLALGEKLGQEL